ncbi:BCD family MFS transporter [Sodalinema gerasimenkoae]|uniref:BCD family MFS transporter n=1 Tax=Sodalinema gerasimenkoae TaxID=2862348 RepID=UPI00135846B1|nr:BCD family MFS transporter [Sodalinema gerasimenkoae]
METRDRPATNSDLTPPSLPRLNIFTMFRLGLFQLGLGMMSLLTLAIINRIAIDELRVPALIATGAIAMKRFVSPARVFFGQLSDSTPLFGKHRSGYVWIGAVLFTSLSFITVQVLWQLGLSLQTNGMTAAPTYGWAALFVGCFMLYGLSIDASSTPFAAMLVDISDEDHRSKLIGVAGSMLILGTIAGAMIGSTLLNQPETGAETLGNLEQVDIPALSLTVNRVFIIVPAIVLSLCFLATVGIEEKYSRYHQRSMVADSKERVTLKMALRVLTASRQTWFCLSFLLLLTISLFMYDVVIEPYGGQVFGMSIAATTQLNIFLGIGTIVGISSAGFVLVPRLGTKRTSQYGCLGASVCALLFIIAGVDQRVELLQTAFLFYGLFAGTLMAGVTNLMLDLTAAETAGTFIGALGLAKAMARGISAMISGGVLNFGTWAFESPLLAYGLVFLLQALGLLLALVLLKRINIKEFQASTQNAVSRVMEEDLE